MSACRLLLESRPRSGAWNMAVDEVLLESAIARGLCSVRVYRWSEATFSLGYFQRWPDPGLNPELEALPKVRRLSGGGAILHHHELTYSCAVPAGEPLARSPAEIYKRVHEKVILLLGRCGIEADRRGPTGGSGEAQGFLCFSRADPNDVILKGHKIAGSAQRRRRGAVLQHGSLLLSRSRFAPHLPGLLDLASLSAQQQRGLPDQLGRELASAFSVSVSVEGLTEAENGLAEHLQECKYRSTAWPRRARGRTLLQ